MCGTFHALCDCCSFAQLYCGISTWYHIGDCIRGSTINQNKTNLKDYNNFMYKFKIKCSIFYEKIVNSNIWSTNLQTFLYKLHGLPISPKRTNFTFFKSCQSISLNAQIKLILKLASLKFKGTNVTWSIFVCII